MAFLLWKESWELGKNPMASKGSPLHGPRIKLIEKAHGLFVLKVNLIFVPENTWWVDSSAISHISLTMHGCLWS